MNDILTRLRSYRVVGIPLIYILPVLLLIALYAAFKLKPTPDETPTDDTAAGDATDDETQPIFIAKPDLNAAGTDSTSATTSSGATNDSWGRTAIDWLVGQGNSVALSTSAITKYLNGDTLTFDEGQLKDQAVKQFGLPPEDIPLGKTAKFAGQASKQGTPPTTHTVKGSKDDTFQELAILYWNRNDPDSIQQLRLANLGLSGTFPVGTVVKIPKHHAPKYYKATSATRTAQAIAAKNGTNVTVINTLNPNMKFPVKVGTRVQVA